jgi:Zn-dependent peptidase ImmA (M78 family)
MSQEALSGVFGFENRQTLAQIEAGQRKLSADELVTAVEAFEVPLDYFTNPFLIVGEGRFSWRRDAQTVASDLKEFERKAGEWIGAYRSLSASTGEALSPVVHRLNLMRSSSFEDAEAAGEWIASHFDLLPVPSAKLADTMQEKLSTLVLMVDARNGISGAACLVRDLGAVLVNRLESPGRRNYDLAHELFHILTWDAMPPDAIDDGEGSTKAQKRVEQMADKFASALLMPRAALDGFAGPSDVGWLNRTATALGVSSDALRWRMVSLGRMDIQTARSIDPALLRNNGGAFVPEAQPPHRFGKRFMEVLGNGISQGHVSVRRVSALLDVSIDELGELFEVHDLVRPFDL